MPKLRKRYRLRKKTSETDERRKKRLARPRARLTVNAIIGACLAIHMRNSASSSNSGRASSFLLCTQLPRRSRVHQQPDATAAAVSFFLSLLVFVASFFPPIPVQCILSFFFPVFDDDISSLSENYSTGLCPLTRLVCAISSAFYPNVPVNWLSCSATFFYLGIIEINKWFIFTAAFCGKLSWNNYL